MRAMRSCRGLAPLLAGLALPLCGGANAIAAAPPQLVDRVVAMVDQDPILLSDVERAIQLGLIDAQPGETEKALRRRALDQLVEQRLRGGEVERFGFQDVPVTELDAQLAAVRGRFADEAAFAAQLSSAGIDEAGLRQMLARQLLVLLYVEERLGPRVFVGLEDVRKHYQEILAPQLTKAGQPVPAIDEVREDIRTLLKQQRLNEEIARWTSQLRREADVVDYLDSDHGTLPPPVPVSKKQ